MRRRPNPNHALLRVEPPALARMRRILDLANALDRERRGLVRLGRITVPAHARAVLCLTDGRRFERPCEAAEWAGVSQRALNNALARGTASGERYWCYADQFEQLGPWQRALWDRAVARTEEWVLRETRPCLSSSVSSVASVVASGGER